MITRIGMAPRRKGLSAEAFQAHWRGRHGELAARLPGVTRYWQNHALLRDGEPLLPWPGFDACAEIDSPDLATMQAAFATPLYVDEIRADEALLIDKAKGGMILAERSLLSGRIGEGGVRLLAFLRSAPTQSADALHEALRTTEAAPGATARELYCALPPERAGGHRSIFDAVDILWFARAEDAERFVVSARAREQRDGFCHLVRGTERLLAEPRVVV